ncbi:MAG: MBL fold metallo-hydrolase [Sulfurospirillaceae bacterium]|nr:MBL fold metallo-hydrolase [Sulfurospirillaceae bacterium]MDD2826196.1 MBL fold metallo-hydrolase [Sulfurospirillaceae bacterium]
MKFEFLGTSDTGGIPLHHCECAICEEARQKGTSNRSTCAYLELDDGSIILLDAGYDLLSDTFNTRTIRAVFLTHFHADHCLGLIRLRKSESVIECFIPHDTQGFGDLFLHKDSIVYTILEPFQTQYIENISITAVPLHHSKVTNGYVIKTDKATVAYLTDCASIPSESLSYLKESKIDYLFLDACYEPQYANTKHLNWESATDYIDTIGVKEGFLVHASCKTLRPLKKSGKVLKYSYIEQGFKVEV